MNPLIANGFLIEQIIPSVLSNSPSSKWGVPSTSLMITSKPTYNSSNINGQFSKGSVTSNQASISTSMITTGGTIGGWIIDPISISSPSGNIVISSQGDYIQIGGNISLNGNTGQLIASNAVIEGQITASTGQIGGFYINQTELYGAGTISGGTLNGNTINGGVINGGIIYGTTIEGGTVEIGGTSPNWITIINNSGITTSNIQATGGTLGGLTVNGILSIENASSSGNGYIQFQDSLNVNDAAILEDQNDYLLIRAGVAGNIQFQSQFGLNNWASITGSGISLPGSQVFTVQAGGASFNFNNSGTTVSKIAASATGGMFIYSGSNPVEWVFSDLSSNTWTLINNSGIEINYNGGVNCAGGTVNCANLSTGTLSADGITFGASQINASNIIISSVSGTAIETGATGNIICGGSEEINGSFVFFVSNTWGGQLNENVNGTGGSSPVDAAVFQNLNAQLNGSQFVWSNISNTAIMALDYQGDLACFNNITQGANHSGVGWLTCNNLQVVSPGSKNAVEWTSKGAKLIHSIESPEVWYEDIGEGIIKNGTCKILIDSLFLEVTEGKFQVNISPYGKCGYIYSVRGTEDFTVFSDADIEFNYRISRHRTYYNEMRFGNWEDVDNILTSHPEHQPRTESIKEQFETYKQNKKTKVL